MKAMTVLSVVVCCLSLIQICVGIADFTSSSTWLESLDLFEECTDYDPNCPLWGANECDVNPGFMYYQCTKQCNVGCDEAEKKIKYKRLRGHIGYKTGKLCHIMGAALKSIQKKGSFLQLLASDNFVDTIFGIVRNKFITKTQCDLNDNDKDNLSDCYGFAKYIDNQNNEEVIIRLKYFINNVLYTSTLYNVYIEMINDGYSIKEVVAAIYDSRISLDRLFNIFYILKFYFASDGYPDLATIWLETECIMSDDHSISESINYNVTFIEVGTCQFNECNECGGIGCVPMWNEYVKMCADPNIFDIMTEQELNNTVYQLPHIGSHSLCFASPDQTKKYHYLCKFIADSEDAYCDDRNLCIFPQEPWDSILKNLSYNYSTTANPNDLIDFHQIIEIDDDTTDAFIIAPKSFLRNGMRRLFAAEMREKPTDPTLSPSTDPTRSPSTDPTRSPSPDPSGSPSTDPTPSPSADPTSAPSTDPTGSPSTDPTRSPSTDPTGSPSTDPTGSPSTDPTRSPSTDPTSAPSTDPTGSPSTDPTGSPSTDPTDSPSTDPTRSPSIDPTVAPTQDPNGGGITDPPTTAHECDVLVATDGFGSDQDRQKLVIPLLGRIRSHVYNFYEDYQTPAYLKEYIPGQNKGGLFWYKTVKNGWPVTAFFTVSKKVDYARVFVCDRIYKYKYLWRICDVVNVDLVGFSRGGLIAINIAIALNDEGCNINGEKIQVPVRWLGLYDPVDSEWWLGDDIPANVQSVAIVYADRRYRNEVRDEDKEKAYDEFWKEYYKFLDGKVKQEDIVKMLEEFEKVSEWQSTITAEQYWKLVDDGIFLLKKSSIGDSLTRVRPKMTDAQKEGCKFYVVQCDHGAVGGFVQYIWDMEYYYREIPWEQYEPEFFVQNLYQSRLADKHIRDCADKKHVPIIPRRP